MPRRTALSHKSASDPNLSLLDGALDAAPHEATDTALELTPANETSGWRFEYSARAIGEALDVRLIASGGDQASDEPLELEIETEKLTGVSRDFIESMGGQAPYDRCELRWPLGFDDPLTLHLALQVVRDEGEERKGADSLEFVLPHPIKMPAILWEEVQPLFKPLLEKHSAVTTFHPWSEADGSGGVWCQIGQSIFRFRVAQVGFLARARGQGETAIVWEACSLADLHLALETRNAMLGIAPDLPSQPPQKKRKKRAVAPASTRLEKRDERFPVHTGEEWTAVIQSAADGKNLLHFAGNEQSGVLRHQRPDTPFYTETMLLDEERNAGHGIELLRYAASQLDVDDGLAWLYISHLLAPAAPLLPNSYAGGWVDLDDVARKTMGGYARNPQEAKKRRAKVWRAICYGARSHIGGQRSVPYFDKTTGKEITTEIYTSLWQIVARQKTGQMPLFGQEEEEAPLRVELVASREWTALTTEASTAQYLPFGEVLGALPANQAGGAWARVLGLAYINWTRRRVADALEAKNLPTRRELLEAFPSKVAPYREILEGNNPRRALDYWSSAEGLLHEMQIIETSTNPYEPPTRKGWQTIWLGESPDWKPGPLLRPILEELQKKRFSPVPRPLQKPKHAKRKRRDLPSPE